MDTTFDESHYIVRSRRRADLSQRDLAAALGISKSLVSGLETGSRRASIRLLGRILALAGLRLAVVDEQGHEVDPFPAEAVRDNAGRRFPAHLDVAPPEEVPPARVQFPRYDRLPARGWYHRRKERDVLRHEDPAPQDHPTVTELAEYSERFAARRRKRLWRARPRPVEPECTCETECWLGRACLPECRCQCEPSAGGWPARGPSPDDPGSAHYGWESG